ncbi:hypothetical protein OA92_01585 [Marinomonas sp. SBI22]|uniref:hypothetical protein n=1 Tax=unclassified Marinomonas TaxID=196814 RepID=UPI0007AF9BB2|nr:MULTISPECIES: hypothetical protein [unclassified Marinomonas]KZM45910.1 hypothetical protein OA92_01585 [Marinomonas sp. SBI22]KZM46428.1 hypothetical protein OA91_05730 [Marinomonas sp. SBI8L]
MVSKIDITMIIAISFLFGFGVGEQEDYEEAKTVFDVIVALGTGVLAFIAFRSFSSWKDQYKTSRQTECIKAIQATIYAAQDVDDELIDNFKKQTDLEWRLERITKEIAERLQKQALLLQSVNSDSPNSEKNKIITKIENSDSENKPFINLQETWQSEIYELSAIKAELSFKQNKTAHQLHKKCIELKNVNSQIDTRKIISNRESMNSHIQNNNAFDIETIQQAQLAELDIFYSIANPFQK